MIIRRFLQWTTTAPAEARAEGVVALARAVVDREFEPAEHREAEAALMALLDDPSPEVRLAMAQALASSPATPPVLVTALAADRSDIAALMLEFSPVLGIAELIDAAAVGDAVVQAAVARRAGLGVALSAALAEVAAASACVALCGNETASIPDSALMRMIARFGHDAELRAAIAARPHLPAGLRCDLVAKTAHSLGAFVSGCGWLSPERAARLTRDAADQASLTIAADALRSGGAPEVVGLVRHLRAGGCLTPALILRAILCGNTALFEAALSDLSGLPLTRVAGIVATGPSLGFRALYAKCRLPLSLRPAFEAAIQQVAGGGTPEGTVPQRGRIGRVLSEMTGHPDLGTVTAMLRRLDAEAARAEARLFAHDSVQETSWLRLPRLSMRDRSLPLSSAA